MQLNWWHFYYLVALSNLILMLTKLMINLIKFPLNIVSLPWHLSHAKIRNCPNSVRFDLEDPKVWALIPLRGTVAGGQGIKESVRT